jgi:hypothetical protein
MNFVLKILTIKKIVRVEFEEILPTEGLEMETLGAADVAEIAETSVFIDVTGAEL